MIAVSIPCYRVKEQILSVIDLIPETVSRVYVVDDCCPEGTGEWVKKHCKDTRVVVLQHEKNQGVGGATLTGFLRAKSDGASIVVKLDGDGQMAPMEIPRLIRPIQLGMADYTKGNRFYALAFLSEMPVLRLLGNSALSFVNKVSSGYWRVMDPTNGYLAIHTSVLGLLPAAQISRGYFFESDMLYQLNIIRAAITDVPMPSRYPGSKSSLSIFRSLVSFPPKYAACFFKRVFYNYFLRDFNLGSAQLMGALALLVGGLLFGIDQWLTNSALGQLTPTGTIMLSIVPMIVGFQLLLGAINYDILSEPRAALHQLLD